LARPLDGHILRHGYSLYSVNNLKLARYKEIFPAPARPTRLMRAEFSNCSGLSEHLPLARDALHEVAPNTGANDRSNVSRGGANSSVERVRVLNRMQSDFMRCAPGAAGDHGESGHLWFSFPYLPSTSYPSWPSAAEQLLQ